MARLCAACLEPVDDPRDHTCAVPDPDATPDADGSEAA